MYISSKFQNTFSFHLQENLNIKKENKNKKIKKCFFFAIKNFVTLTSNDGKNYPRKFLKFLIYFHL